MGFFRRDPRAERSRLPANRQAESGMPLSDEEWLAAGHRRFEKEINKYYGSPETMRAGGERMLATGDQAAAVFFFGKAVDMAQTWLSRPGERTHQDDVELFDLYVRTVEMIRVTRPSADVVSDSYNENATYIVHRMIDVAGAAQAVGRPAGPLYTCVQKLVDITGMPPP